jgi:hypothetical protein
VRRWLLGLGLTVAAALPAVATAAAPPAMAAVGASTKGDPVWVTSLPDDADQFSGYDFRQDGFGSVDWPVEFVFRGNASVQKVRDGLCHGTQQAWKYCDEGGPMYLYAKEDGPDGVFDGFVADSGVKRFEEDCATHTFTAHMRIYAPPSKHGGDGARSFYSVQYGDMVIGTTHLDFEDHAGCSGRIHGYPDVAQQWFVEAMKTIPGWKISAQGWDLGNGSDPYVIMRDLAGAMVPHVYGHDGSASDVVIP